jgi:hypothetical protein
MRIVDANVVFRFFTGRLLSGYSVGNSSVVDRTSRKQTSMGDDAHCQARARPELADARWRIAVVVFEKVELAKPRMQQRLRRPLPGPRFECAPQPSVEPPPWTWGRYARHLHAWM